MDELSRNGQTPILVPVESPRLEGKVDEYRLVGEPTCLHEIIDFLCDGKRAIWTSPSACIFTGAESKIPATVDNQLGHLLFKKYNKTGKFLESTGVSIMGKAQEDKLDCFEFLIRLPDAVYDGIQLRSSSPLTPRVLKIMLDRKPRKGRYSFYGQCLSAECGRVLATSGSETQLRFLPSCRFEDGGEAFVKALSQRQDETEGPSEVSLQPNELFDEEYQHQFSLALQKTSLQKLSLYSGTSLDEHASRLVALARVRMLSLSLVQLADDGEALAASIRRGHGPRGLQIFYSTSEISKTILDAVGDERCLIEDLIIDGRNLDPKRLAGALERNRSLRHFELHSFNMNRPSWERFLRAICIHPTLQALRFACVTTGGVADDSERRQRTEDLAVVLTTNHRVRDVTFYPNTFDQATWDNRVAPLLERNRWRQNICRLWRIEPESTRASLLAVCLSKVAAGSNNNPSAVNLLLSSNQGLIASYCYGGGPIIRIGHGLR